MSVLWGLWAEWLLGTMVLNQPKSERSNPW